jgi:hypothetical protein
MDQFIRSQNVARYRRLLERVTEESDRQTIFNLLAEEQQKQKTRAIQFNLMSAVGPNAKCRNVRYCAALRV